MDAEPQFMCGVVSRARRSTLMALRHLRATLPVLAIGTAFSCTGPGTDAGRTASPDEKAGVVRAAIEYRVGYLRDHEALFLRCAVQDVVGSNVWLERESDLVRGMLTIPEDGCDGEPEVIERGTERVRVDSLDVDADSARVWLTVFVPNGTFDEALVLRRTREMRFVVDRAVQSRFSSF